MNDSKFVKHIPCDECGSSDGRNTLTFILKYAIIIDAK